jgi:NTP pyrophosphatase (non-canonical NTP hydrolase)
MKTMSNLISDVISTNHAEMVRCLAKPGEKILESLTPMRCDALHMSSKLCSEAGELMDAIGKWVYYEGDLDRKNVVEELGDIEFYLEGLRQALGIDRAMTLTANYDKLSTRYPNLVYSDKSAIERADKK